MIYTLSFTTLICVYHFRSGVLATYTNDLKPSDGNGMGCEEIIKPGWSILSLANVTLDAWPDCLYSNLDKAFLQKLISDSSSSITDATEKGYIGFVQYYVRSGKECDKIEPGSSLLQLAAENGHTNILKYFARRFVSRSLNKYRRSYSWTALEEAVYLGRHLLFCDGGRYKFPRSGRETRRTILMSGARNGHISIVKYLVDQRKVDENYNKEERNEVLHQTAISGSLAIMKYLIDEKGYVINEDDGDLLGLAAIAGNIDLLKYLVFDKKLNTTTKTKGGETGLHIAVLAGNLEVVRFFVDNLKYDPLIKDEASPSPLHLAVLAGNLEIVKYFIEEKNINLEAAVRDENILTSAAECNRVTILKYLADEKNINIQMLVTSKRAEEYTPLQIALLRGHMSIVKYLIDEKDADLNVKDYQGNNLALIATKTRNLSFLKYLINVKKLSDQVNEPNNENLTVPLLATIDNQLSTVKFLLEGNYINDVNFVLRAAVYNCFDKIVKYLVEEKGFRIDESDVKRREWCEKDNHSRPESLVT